MVTWNYPTRVVFGAGALALLPEELRRMGCRRALVVTDAGVAQTRLVQAVQGVLDEANVATAVYSGIQPNPKEEDIAAGVALLRAHDADVLIGLGGGSPLDGAKLIAVRHAVERPFSELDDAIGGDRYIPESLLPVVAIPTTAGTGSEVGRAAVVTANGTGRKTVVFSPAMLPKLALLDPEMTVGLPPAVTAATGYDALTHCLEAFVARGDHPMADGIALEGMRLVARSLLTATEEGDNLLARGDMLKAAMMGAAAFQKGLGACHSMAHPLSSEFDLHHGLANALCLPEVVRFNLESAADRYDRVAPIFGAKSGAHLPECLAEFRTRLGLPSGLRGQRVDEAHLERLAQLAMLDGCHPQNPRSCTESDFVLLFRACLDG